MSSRQLKKLHKQQERLKLQELAYQQQESSEEDVAPPKPRASAFARLAALHDDDAPEDNDEKDEQNWEKAEDKAAADKPPKSKGAEMSKIAKKNKKFKTRNKNKNKVNAAPNPETRQIGTVEDGPDEIDVALKELSFKRTSQAAGAPQTPSVYDADLARLLSITFDRLKVIKELKAMFGRETIDSVRNEEQEQAQARPHRRGPQRRTQPENVDMEAFLRAKPGEKMPEVVLRKNPFVQGKENWPRASAGGLKMQAITDEWVEPTEYVFTYDRAYGALERKFYDLVNMMDPMGIVYFVRENPYHVNGLITAHRVAMTDSNAALAADLLERALFTFGRVTLSPFRKKLERGVARLDFRRPENRQFWLAGYHYIKSLMQKGTYSTALEWTKLFLSLSPNDEYAMMNFTHVLSIYAYEAEWFITLCDSAYFNSDEYDFLPMREYHRQTCVLAKLSLKDRDGALRDLVKGMESLPWLYSSLCRAVDIDIPPSLWAVQPRDTNDRLYTELYVHMSKDLWKKEAEAIGLLKEAGGIAHKVDVRCLPAAKEIPLSVSRFIYLDSTPELMGLVPSHMLHASPNFDHDPLPPPLEDNVLSNVWQSWPWLHVQSPGQPRNGEMPGIFREADRLAWQHGAAIGPRQVPEAEGVSDLDHGDDDELVSEILNHGDDDEVSEILNHGTAFLSRLARLLIPVFIAHLGQSQENSENAMEGILEDDVNPSEEHAINTPEDEDEEHPALIHHDEEQPPALVPYEDGGEAEEVEKVEGEGEEKAQEEEQEEEEAKEVTTGGDEVHGGW